MATDSKRRERICPHLHESIQDAIRCAEASIGIQPGQKMQPYWGTMRMNSGLIVGWKIGNLTRWRLDYEPGADGKGPHINEEDFRRDPHLAKVVHLIRRPAIAGEARVYYQWKHWTAAGDIAK